MRAYYVIYHKFKIHRRSATFVMNIVERSQFLHEVSNFFSRLFISFLETQIQQIYSECFRKFMLCSPF